MKLVLIAVIVMVIQGLRAQNGYGEIRGLIKDEEHNPVIGAVVKIIQGGYLLGGTTTDIDGKYVYKPLNAGQYDVIISSMGYSTMKKLKVEVKPSEASYVDFKMKINTLEQVVVLTSIYEEPLIDLSMTQVTSLNVDEFNKSANRGSSLVDVIATVVSDMVQDNSGEYHMRGARNDATEYLIDGIKVTSLNGVPNSAVENLSVISGGVPAMFGDLTSGVIMVTTKDYFSGIRAKRVRESEYAEKIAMKKHDKAEKQEEEKRAKEIEQEKMNDKKAQQS